MSGIHRIETSLGPVQAAFDADGAVIYLGFADHEFRMPLLRKLARLGPVPRPDATGVGRLREQLEAYAAGQRKAFDVPLRLHGSPFEQRVWAGLQRLPFGETRSYGALARAIARPTASRAVGHANSKNPISILVPCHRVIGSDGALTGYAGGAAAKQWLLAHEATTPR